MVDKRKTGKIEKRTRNEQSDGSAEEGNNAGIDEVLSQRYGELNFFGELSEGFKHFFLNIHRIAPVFIIAATIFGIAAVIIFSDINYSIAHDYKQFTDIAGTNSSTWTEEQYAYAISLMNRMTIVTLAETVLRFMHFVLAGFLTAKMMIGRISGNKIGYGESFGAVLNGKRRKILLSAVIVYAGLIGGGIMFMIIPGLLVLMAIGYSFFLMPETELSLKEYISRSYRMGMAVKRMHLKLFFLLLLAYIFYNYAVQQLAAIIIKPFSGDYLTVLDPANRNYLYLFGIEGLNAILVGIFEPIILWMPAVQYVEIKVKLGDKILDREFVVVEPPGAEGDESSTGDKKKIKIKKAKVLRQAGKSPRFFCPYCGFRLRNIDGKIVKCTNCGNYSAIPDTK